MRGASMNCRTLKFALAHTIDLKKDLCYKTMPGHAFCILKRFWSKSSRLALCFSIAKHVLRGNETYWDRPCGQAARTSYFLYFVEALDESSSSTCGKFQARAKKLESLLYITWFGLQLTDARHTAWLLDILQHLTRPLGIPIGVE